ncbi:sulfatase-like hydrolase/transferase [Alsobacter sp. SYSU M60028]|uniref:Sulfatase-like hydrolase/transferase n=1 Tax=Alsobacter ponti TaxID=2962936 RepID=A0ABT1LFS2_9HYPH|nr:sulfatase-like hydrolase/transferase [Alsobacter ponti]MCP8939108.1 sulfatase-like hydrolase/transferase [Alsobacter ponti]
MPEQSQAAGRPQPDILFFYSDQHARHVVGHAGDAVAVTPNLDRLARSGVWFDSAYCPSPICTPSRMSMLTGQWPHEQGCWTLEDQLRSDRPTYAHALGAAGYRTVLCGRMHSVGPDQLHGYAERDVGDCSPNWPGAPRQDLGVLAGAQGPARVSLERSGRGQSGYEVVDRAAVAAALERIAEIARARKAGSTQPVFLTVSFVLPHCPFVARAEDFDLFEGRVGPPRLGRPDPDREHPATAAWRRACGIEDFDPQAVIRARTAYYGLVRRLDAMIGEVLDAWHAAGLGGDSLVAYTSDHGEMLGEHGLFWKNCFYEQSVGVPLILSWPGRLPEGARCPRVVNLVDLGATFIAAAGAPALPRSRGRSLLGIAADPDAPWLDETYSEYVTDETPQWTGPTTVQQRMVRAGRWKLVVTRGERPQLFDLAADPDELRDLAEDPALADLRRDLEARVLRGWDADAIAREVAMRRREKNLLAEWARRTHPRSTLQFPITAADSWLDGG